MNQIAFFYGNTVVYWNSVILALAVAVGILFFLAAWLRTEEHFFLGVVICPVVMVLSLLLGRIIHWYFRADSYDSFQAALSSFGGTGYALMGAFAASLLTAGALRLLKLLKNLPAALDAMCIGGCAAIGLGRLSCQFSADNRGDILTGFTQLPWASPIVNATSGVLEYRLATFCLQAMVVGVIFLAILWLFHRKHKAGDVTLLFLLLYCASQAVLDSARYDALRLRSNGFISAVQVLCAITLVVIIGILFFRLKKQMGFKPVQLTVWAATAASLGGAGYMEYYVQRRGGEALFAYLTMSGCLLVTVAAGLILLFLTSRSQTPAPAGEEIPAPAAEEASAEAPAEEPAGDTAEAPAEVAEIPGEEQREEIEEEIEEEVIEDTTAAPDQEEKDGE